MLPRIIRERFFILGEPTRVVYVDMGGVKSSPRGYWMCVPARMEVGALGFEPRASRTQTVWWDGAEVSPRGYCLTRAARCIRFLRRLDFSGRFLLVFWQFFAAAN